MRQDVIEYLESNYGMDSNGYIEVSDFDSRYINAKEIIELIMKSDRPEEVLCDYLFDCYADSEGECRYDILDDICKHFDLSQEERDEVEDYIYVESNAYKLIYDVDVPVTVVLNYGDMNYEYTVNSLLNYYGDLYGNKTIDPNSGMLLLARRMKCEKELKAAIREWFDATYYSHNHSTVVNEFIDEFENNLSSLSAAAILCHMTIGDIVKYKSYYEDIRKDGFDQYHPRRYRKGNNKVLTVKPGASIGLYDYCCGSGSLLGIENKEEFSIPLKYINHIESVEDIDRVYGLVISNTNKSKAEVIC